MKRLKQWWLKFAYGIGEKVYWQNDDDERFTGEYVITKKMDKEGYIGIYNDKVGHRTVPSYYLKRI